MLVHEHASLQAWNTFRMPARAATLVECFTEDDVATFFAEKRYATEGLIILGGGSNILFQRDTVGCVLRVALKGRSVVAEDEHSVIVRLAAGERWHDCVEWAVEQGWGGIENLALIPGTVGAAPIQNIGAYGVEVRQVIHAVECIMCEGTERRRLNADECQFGYRDSIFKQELAHRCVITAVELRLQKQAAINVTYKDVRQYFEQHGISVIGLRDVFDAVVSIRRAKLPDVSVIGSAGSFFKNPVIDLAQAESIKDTHPELPMFGTGSTRKIPAAWLIEQCGFKGIRRGDAGVYEKHALVLVNHGAARGSDILALAREIQNGVHSVFGIQLETEVNFY